MTSSMKSAKGSIKHNSWDEQPYREANGQKSTMAVIECALDGNLEAIAPTRFLMQYLDAANCHYAGYLLVDGKLDGRRGTFIIHEMGVWEDGVASSTWQIVASSGTGELKGIAGSGRYAAAKDQTVRYELEYELAD